MGETFSMCVCTRARPTPGGNWWYHNDAARIIAWDDLVAGVARCDRQDLAQARLKNLKSYCFFYEKV